MVGEFDINNQQSTINFAINIDIRRRSARPLTC
jgi:hypothetical protein